MLSLCFASTTDWEMARVLLGVVASLQAHTKQQMTQASECL